MTAVKVCGITNLDDAVCAARAGADFLGFIFYRQSLRYIPPEEVGSIAAALHAELGESGPRLVGVFVDEPYVRIHRVFDEARLDLIQLHGTEAPSAVAALHPVAFKALRPRSHAEVETALVTYGRVWMANSNPDEGRMPELLVDAYHPEQKGGTGERADTAIARWLAARCRMMLAGGLTPENVADAITDIHPWGVDVSSGVERAKGVKDQTRVRAFIQAVRAADCELAWAHV